MLAVVAGVGRVDAADSARWIGPPRGEQSHTCYYRVTWRLPAVPVRATATAAARDALQLYINGRQAEASHSEGRRLAFDLTGRLTTGENLIAVKVVNGRGGPAELAMRITAELEGGRRATLVTGPQWLARTRVLPFWTASLYRDSRWPSPTVGARWPAAPPAVADRDQSRGSEAEGKTAGEPTPAEGVAEHQAASGEDGDAESAPSPYVAPGFALTPLLDDAAVGSLAAMTFDEFGRLVVAQEGGPLLLVFDSDRDGRLDSSRVYCERIRNSHGLLALNGELFATGDGPNGAGLYRLTDADRDGVLERVRLLIGFDGSMGRWGPHGVALGPDGLLYVVAGPTGRPQGGWAENSPYAHVYQGDLGGLGLEDPTGHEPPASAPGGVVLRTDAEGSAVQLVAGGLRNAYDLAFDRLGELFVHDSGNSADAGLPWERTAALLHVTPGAEFGWRSGSRKWPVDAVDALPPLLQTGAAAPSGVAYYGHRIFPKEHQDSLLLADWGRGTIHRVGLERSGASYRAESQLLLEHPALRIMDLETGPDGAVYFVTGGNGAAGGVYRLSWEGDVPPAARRLGGGVAAAVRQPQADSAWARQALAALKAELGDRWGPLLAGVARADENPWRYRVQALELLQLYGPPPGPALLAALAQADAPEVRTKTAQLLGLQRDEQAKAALLALLDDEDAGVRRTACESLLRAGWTAPWDSLERLLTSEDRREARAARLLLERLDPDQWRDRVLTTDDHRLFIQGALALVTRAEDKAESLRVVRRFSQLLSGFISDPDFMAMLRLVAVALERGAVTPEEAGPLGRQIAEEFPARHPGINRLLAPLLVYFQDRSAAKRAVAYVLRDARESERLELALRLSPLGRLWDPAERRELLAVYDELLAREAGPNYTPYLLLAVRDIAQGMTEAEARSALAEGAERPAAALAALYRLPRQLDQATVDALLSLDAKLAERPQPLARRLQLGVVAVLARSGQEEALAALEAIWDRDPDRRGAIALAGAHCPNDDVWALLVRSLPWLDAASAPDVLARLEGSPQISDDPDDLRQLILLAQRLGPSAAAPAGRLLQRWSGVAVAEPGQPWEETMGAWAKWLAARYGQPSPDASPPAQIGRGGEPTPAARR